MVYMLGGAPANGKSTLVDSGILPHPKGILKIDPDAIKSMIPEYNRMLNSGDEFLSKAAAKFTHEESSHISKVIQRKLNEGRIDYILDGVNDGSFEKLSGRDVPLDFVNDMNSEISKLVPEIIKNKAVDELYLWDTNINGNPRLILEQVDGKLKIHDQRLYDAFLVKYKR